ncbi:DUF2059 domain-containing protein [Roseateles toxinivorans]|uniref:DUF2059 domain-containing protein n=1 Tax=Roseateles toxinivorans TaxID=270368 RepID=A0A4R6QK49_9BURK|nr:DUF2059 domain-containing protein [Roseateles toxinivorans]TDP63012.1 hypothetical protein DES47_10512 [Roseateles toxinivorans]
MKFHLKQLTVAAALLLAFGAQAQTAAAPSAAKKELIAKVLAFQQPGIESLARALVEQPAARMMQGAGAALQQVPADKREATAKAIEADVRKFVDEASALTRDKAVQLAPTTIGPMLDEKFNEDELKQLIAWFESPVNKKYQQMGGEMQNALGQKLVAEMRGAIEGRLKTLEQGVAKRLGLSPQPAPTAPTTTKPVTPSTSAAKK